MLRDVYTLNCANGSCDLGGLLKVTLSSLPRLSAMDQTTQDLQTIASQASHATQATQATDRVKGLSLGSPVDKSPRGNLKLRNKRAFRSLRGSEPRSTGHVVLKIVDLSGKSPRDIAIFALSSELEEPPRGPLVGPTGPYLSPNRGVWLSSANTPGTKLF